MKTIRTLVLLPAALVALACNKADDKKVDDALNNDLSLAQQNRPYSPLDTVSAAERNLAASKAAAPAPTTVTHRTVVHHVYSGASTSGTRTRSGPIDHVEKNTGRDAAIGAGAGAILGATTSRDKVKGGLIGAAAGGLLGAVIGNNVDKKKVPNQ